MAPIAEYKDGNKSINRTHYWSLKNKEPWDVTKFTFHVPMWNQFAYLGSCNKMHMSPSAYANIFIKIFDPSAAKIYKRAIKIKQLIICYFKGEEGVGREKNFKKPSLNLHWCFLTTCWSMWVVSKKWIKTLCQSSLSQLYCRGMLHLWSLTRNYSFRKNIHWHVLLLRFGLFFRKAFGAHPPYSHADHNQKYILERSKIHGN